MDKNPIISTQVLAEVSNVGLKKFKLPHETLLEYLELLNHQCNVQLLLPGDFSEAVSLAKKYRYGFYDSLIIAVALRAESEVLYSEDMHHGHKIEGLNIINPFI